MLTHLRHRAAPLLRFRTRDHVAVRTSPCPCGRTGPRIRCLGRTDDMLIVRGVNVFPSAVRDVVSAFVPEVSGHVLVRPRARGVTQEPPLPVRVELARDARATPRSRTRSVRDCAPCSCPDGDRARTVGQRGAERVQVDTGRARSVRKLQAQGVHHITIVGATGRRRSTSGRACSGCRSCSSSRTSTTRRRATSTSTPATDG